MAHCRQYLLSPLQLGIPNNRTRFYMTCDRLGISAPSLTTPAAPSVLPSPVVEDRSSSTDSTQREAHPVHTAAAAAAKRVLHQTLPYAPAHPDDDRAVAGGAAAAAGAVDNVQPRLTVQDLTKPWLFFGSAHADGTSTGVGVSASSAAVPSAAAERKEPNATWTEETQDTGTPAGGDTESEIDAGPSVNKSVAWLLDHVKVLSHYLDLHLDKQLVETGSNRPNSNSSRLARDDDHQHVLVTGQVPSSSAAHTSAPLALDSSALLSTLSAPVSGAGSSDTPAVDGTDGSANITHPARSIAPQLAMGSWLDHQSLYLPEALFDRGWMQGMSIVGPHDRVTFCFTGGMSAYCLDGVPGRCE